MSTTPSLFASPNLTDYDELHTYNTDPLNPDTDGDTIIDGDEIKLGLDPNNAETNDYPDNEYMSVQIIPYDHEILSDINTEDNPYKLSIEIIAAGLAENNLEVIHSGYSYTMCNSSTLGSAPELIYNENFKVENVKLKFEIGDDYIDNIVRLDEEKTEDLTGINRLCIFKYFEDIDMLLPIQTEYEGTNVVYATIDAFEKDENGNSYGIGSYCLIDMEMWKDNLTGAYNDQQGIDEVYPSVENQDSIASKTEEISLNSSIVASENSPKASITDLINITKALFNTIRTNFAAINKGKTQVPYWTYRGHKYALFENTGLSWEEANARCKDMGGHLLTVTSSGELWFLQNCISANAKHNFYWVGAKNNGSWDKWVTGEPLDFVKTIRVNGYGLSSFSYDELFYAVGMAYTKNFSTNSCGFICEWESGRAIRDPEQIEAYFVLLPNGTKNVCLDSKLSADSDTDTDGDGIPDYDEINFKAIRKISGSNTVNLKQCFEYVNKLGFELSDEFIASKMDSSNGTQYAPEMLEQMIVYPVNSDPTDPDTDGDYYLDNVDSNALKWNKMIIPDNLIDDSNSIYGNNPSTNVDPKVSDGTITQVQVDGGSTKNQITFNRSTLNKNSSKCQFVLTPEDSSDYIITVTDVNITAAVDSSKFLTVNNKAEQYASPYFDAANSSITYYYKLKKDKDYIINITNTAAASDFTVTISQDNWVYAPNGGIRTGVNNPVDGTFADETYLTSTTLGNVIYAVGLERYSAERWKKMYNTPQDLIDSFNNPNGLREFTDDWLGDIAAMGLNIDYSNESEIIDTLGNISYLAGAILSFPIPGNWTKEIAVMLVIGDGFMLAATSNISTTVDMLKDALVNGKYNICIRSKPVVIDEVVGTGIQIKSQQTEYEAWSNIHYINKYYKYNQSKRCDVIPFETSTGILKKQDDGTWILQSN